MGMVQGKLRVGVFFPPFLLLFIATILCFFYQEQFLTSLNRLHHAILYALGPLYSLVAFFMVLMIFVVYASPLGKVKIGGKEAKPDLTHWQWFTISLCSTVASGLLFWATSEPLYHYFFPPAFIELRDPVFSLAGLLFHWTLTPYAIYTIPALLFAINYYNFKCNFSFSSCLYPLFSKHSSRQVKGLIDCICLYSLVIGMAASLTAAVLILWGGLNHLFTLPKNALTLGAIALCVVATFVGAAKSGLMKGVRLLADWNVKLFALIMLYVLCNADLPAIAALSLKSLRYYSHHFTELSLYPARHPEDGWGYQWGTFYWAIWMGWAPIVALFLGKIAKGYTVRAFIIMNFVVPSVFSFFWLSLFGGLSLSFRPIETLYSALVTNGPESIIYLLMAKMPFAAPLIGLFILACFLSITTTANANTLAMADICTHALGHSRHKTLVKIIWGMLLGTITYFTVVYTGIDGIKMLSNLSGMPILILLVFVSLALLKLTLQTKHEMTALAYEEAQA